MEVGGVWGREGKENQADTGHGHVVAGGSHHERQRKTMSFKKEKNQSVEQEILFLLDFKVLVPVFTEDGKLKRQKKTGSLEGE